MISSWFSLNSSKYLWPDVEATKGSDGCKLELKEKEKYIIYSL